MVGQLVSLNQLDQLISINQTLSGLGSSSSSTSNSAQGKAISAPGATSFGSVSNNPVSNSNAANNVLSTAAAFNQFQPAYGATAGTNVPPDGGEHTTTPIFPPHPLTTKVSMASFEAVKVTLEEAAGRGGDGAGEGNDCVSTAVAGGPFIGLLGTVWGVMLTFAGIAESRAATLTAMAPGVAAALVATGRGPAGRHPGDVRLPDYALHATAHITQELDGSASRYANQIEHAPRGLRPLAYEIRNANEVWPGAPVAR